MKLDTIAGSLVIVSLIILPSGATRAHDQDDDIRVDPTAASVFAVMPGGAEFPEGIAVNPFNGDVFVSTFQGSGKTNGIVRFDRRGRVRARSSFTNAPLLGLLYNPFDGYLYVTSVGNFVMEPSSVLRIRGQFRDDDTLEEVAVIPNLDPPPELLVPNPDGSVDAVTYGGPRAAVPNALALSQSGMLFITDSFSAAVLVIDLVGCSLPCVAHPIYQNGALATTGFPPFGANGIAFRPHTSDPLYIANTGDDRVLTLDLVGLDLEASEPNTDDERLGVFAQSINGADGMAFDRHGKLWVAANQGDHVVSLDEDGRVVDVLGAFLGVRSNGEAKGLIFPASIAFYRGDLFVTNLALPLDGVPGNEWEEEVTRYTVSRIETSKRHRRR